MDVTSTSRLDGGLLERRFTVAGADGRPVPGILWTRESGAGPTPLILIGHGGGGSKDGRTNLDVRDYCTGRKGIATAAIDAPSYGDRGPVTSASHPGFVEMWHTPNVVDDMNVDWARTLDALLALGEFDPDAVGYYGVSMGTMFGLPYVASDSRIAVASLGLCGLRGVVIDMTGNQGQLATAAPRVTCSVLYHVQWDDERFDRDSALELFGMIGSPDKRLQAMPGLHGGLTPEARETLLGFLAGRLLQASAPHVGSAVV